MQEKAERLLDKHMLQLGSSDIHSVQRSCTTNESPRCIKAIIVDILIGEPMGENRKAAGQQLRGKCESTLLIFSGSAMNTSKSQVAAFQIARPKGWKISVVANARRRDYFPDWDDCQVLQRVTA